MFKCALSSRGSSRWRQRHRRGRPIVAIVLLVCFIMQQQSSNYNHQAGALEAATVVSNELVGYRACTRLMLRLVDCLLDTCDLHVSTYENKLDDDTGRGAEWANIDTKLHDSMDMDIDDSSNGNDHEGGPDGEFCSIGLAWMAQDYEAASAGNLIRPSSMDGRREGADGGCGGPPRNDLFQLDASEQRQQSSDVADDDQYCQQPEEAMYLGDESQLFDSDYMRSTKQMDWMAPGRGADNSGHAGKLSGRKHLSSWFEQDNDVDGTNAHNGYRENSEYSEYSDYAAMRTSDCWLDAIKWLSSRLYSIRMRLLVGSRSMVGDTFFESFDEERLEQVRSDGGSTGQLAAALTSFGQLHSHLNGICPVAPDRMVQGKRRGPLDELNSKVTLEFLLDTIEVLAELNEMVQEVRSRERDWYGSILQRVTKRLDERRAVDAIKKHYAYLTQITASYKLLFGEIDIDLIGPSKSAGDWLRLNRAAGSRFERRSWTQA